MSTTRDSIADIWGRGVAEAPARIGDIEPGTLFMPFHYGYWDDPGRPRAANELTLYDWDPVSKQPHFKYAAVRLEKVEGPSLPQPKEFKCEEAPAQSEGTRGARAHLADYIGLLLAAKERLVRGWEKLRSSHPTTPDIGPQSTRLMVNESKISAAVLLQGARVLGDRGLERDLQGVENRNERQRTWLLTRIRQAAPQTLTVPS